jgi:hypothetical protein
MSRALSLAARGVAVLIFSAILLAVQPEIGRDLTSPQQLHLSVTYSGWENTLFSFEPDIRPDWKFGCMSPDFSVNGQRIPFPDGSEEPICHRRIILDLKPYLQRGENRVIVESRPVGPNQLSPSPMGGPVLLGGHWASTLACLGLFALAVWSMEAVLRKLGFLATTRIVVVLASVYFIYWLRFHRNLAYTNDLPGHIAYIKYMVYQWREPFGYRGAEYFHPPFYYLIAARVYAAASAFPQLNPLTAVRLFSWALYSVFLIYGLLTLKESVDSSRLAYHVGVIQMVFWPVSVLMATRITNDVALYAAWSASFYYLERWYRLRRAECLASSLWLFGVALLVKSSAVVLGAIIAGTLAYGVLARRFSVRYFVQRPLVIGACVVMACALLNTSRPIYEYMTGATLSAGMHFGGGGGKPFGIRHYLTFGLREYLEWPFVRWPKVPDMPFLNYVLRTALFGEFTFQHAWLASLISRVLLAQVGLLVLLGVIAFQRRRVAVPAMLSIAIAMLALVALTIRTRWGVSQDVRFVLPMLVPCVVIYAQGLEVCRERGRPILYWFGVAAGLALPALSVSFYLSQYLPIG